MIVSIVVFDQLKYVIIFAIVQVRRAFLVLTLCVEIDVLPNHTSVTNVTSDQHVLFFN
jgi:hypothetical protein